jgi:hypothetical protein
MTVMPSNRSSVATWRKNLRGSAIKKKLMLLTFSAKKTIPQNSVHEFFLMPKINNRPRGNNSTNLVTLAGDRVAFVT